MTIINLSADCILIVNSIPYLLHTLHFLYKCSNLLARDPVCLKHYLITWLISIFSICWVQIWYRDIIQLYLVCGSICAQIEVVFEWSSLVVRKVREEQMFVVSGLSKFILENEESTGKKFQWNSWFVSSLVDNFLSAQFQSRSCRSVLEIWIESAICQTFLIGW